MIKRLLLVANPGVEHVGAHLLYAAKELDIEVRIHNVEEAFRGPSLVRRVNWWLRGHLPSRLDAFSAEVVASAAEFRPDALLTTGIAPVSASALGQLKIPRFNFLTDDPWNRAQHSPWFIRAVPHYDRVFSPRRVVIDDLKRAGAPDVRYLPFAYAPNIHFPDPNATPLPDHDVVFVGGGDRDRMGPVKALIDGGIRVALYGGYWDRDPKTRPFARGFVDPAGLRRVIGGSKVVLGLVRRANRDGHSMRSFEVPAMQGCLLTEDTEEHHEILGDTVWYFRDLKELHAKAAALIQADRTREELAQGAYARIVGGGNTYTDRLRDMLA